MVDTPNHARAVPVPPGRLDDEAWSRLATEGWCYPGEAARILDVAWLDYRQLRVIHELVRKMSGGSAIPGPLPRKAGNDKRPMRPWARYTLRDLACAAEVVRLCVRPVSRSPDSRARLNVAQLKHACERLQIEGMACPLLEVRFDWSAGRLVATSQMVRFDASTGQLLLANAEALTRRYQARRRLDPRLARVIRAERIAVHQARKYQLRMDRRPPRTSSGEATTVP